MPTEDGQDQIECDKFPLCPSWDAAMACLQSLAEEEHEYKTVSIDSVDWLERLAWKKIADKNGKANIEDIGYAKGYKFALDLWRDLLDALDYLREQKGMIVVLVAHSAVEKFNDPEGSAYDRYTPRLHKDASAMIREWVDATLFACRAMRINKEEVGFNKTRATAVAMGKDGGDRILRTVGGPACVAKNRYSISRDLPLSWSEFEQAVAAGVAA